MSKLIKAKTAARKSMKVKLRDEISMINELIEKASDDGKFSIAIDVNDYSHLTEVLLEMAGYKIEYDSISWAHWVPKNVEDEKKSAKVLEKIGIKVLPVQEKPQKKL